MKTIDYENMSLRAYKLRYDNNLTLCELSKELHISKSTIARLESKQQNFTYDFVNAYLEYFLVSAEYLLFNDECNVINKTELHLLDAEKITNIIRCKYKELIENDIDKKDIIYNILRKIDLQCENDFKSVERMLEKNNVIISFKYLNVFMKAFNIDFKDF